MHGAEEHSAAMMHGFAASKGVHSVQTLVNFRCNVLLYCENAVLFQRVRCRCTQGTFPGLHMRVVDLNFPRESCHRWHNAAQEEVETEKRTVMAPNRSPVSTVVPAARLANSRIFSVGKARFVKHLIISIPTAPEEPTTPTQPTFSILAICSSESSDRTSKLSTAACC